jgi:putative ABC transport system ATP-binding protein
METAGNERVARRAAVSMSIELRDLQFGYPDKGFALSVPALSMHPGESVALVGPSGSGKTTLLNLIAGILTPTRGSIILNEVDLSAMGSRQRREHRLRYMGMIFQSFELLSYLDVRDNVLLQGRLCSSVRVDEELETRAKTIATELGLGDKWKRNIAALSQGEQQRVAGCRALLLDPKLVLADEPTGNLDPDNKHAVLKKLVDECKQHQRILLTVTHDHSLLPTFDRVINMASLLDNGASHHE